ncbi:hypothetical protein JOQ06_022697, partial [Pogonophryne albipinna]
TVVKRPEFYSIVTRQAIVLAELCSSQALPEIWADLDCKESFLDRRRKKGLGTMSLRCGAKGIRELAQA